MSDSLPDWLEDAEQAIVEQFDRLLAPIVAKLIATHAATLTADAGDELSYEWHMAVDKLIEEGLMEVYLTAAIEVAGAAPTDPSELFPEVVNTKAIAYQTEATKRVVGITDTLWADLNSRVVENLTVGMDIKTLTKEVEAIGQFATSRSRAIARTETLGAYNGGDWDGAQALGEFGPTHKRWLATTDGRERDSHREANGQVVPMSEPFKVGGGSMMRPHALGAPAGEVVNCRCTTQMFWPGDKLPEGSRAPDGSAMSVVETGSPAPTSPAPTSTGEPWAIDTTDDAFQARSQAALSSRAEPTEYVKVDIVNPNGSVFHGGFTTDKALGDVMKARGQAGLPKAATTSELDALVEAGGREFFRGTGSKAATESFLTGEYASGTGIFGNGFYNSTGVRTAVQYERSGDVLRMVAKPDANFVDMDELVDIWDRMEANGTWAVDKMPGVAPHFDFGQVGLKGGSAAEMAASDMGRFAATLGYDGIIKRRSFNRVRDDYVVVLNREAVAVEKLNNSQVLDRSFADDTLEASTRRDLEVGYGKDFVDERLGSDWKGLFDE